MKKILGLDLGSSSIGWAIIEENSAEVTSDLVTTCNDKIVAMGSRIISADECADFAKGKDITINSDRTAKRTQRKGYDRYQLRRALLIDDLRRLGMFPEAPLKLTTLELWGIRARAVVEKISLHELGRVLLHINQKRGYRTVKSDYGDKKLGDYVKNVVGNHRMLQQRNQTIGQYLYEELSADVAFRCKGIVFPRAAYVEEFDAIMATQRNYYPELLTDGVVAHIRDYIIFHQRPLKSAKHLVARCELERYEQKVGAHIRNCGPKVAPRTSPLFQVCKIWEAINNLNIKNKRNDVLFITQQQKIEIFKYLNVNEKLKAAALKSILRLHTNEWQIGKAIGTGLQGNTTYCAIEKALEGYSKKKDLLAFDINIIDGNMVNTQTGELSKVVDPAVESQPLYQLWHVLYSISNIEELSAVLRNKFGIDNEATIEALCRLDFVKPGYGNKSTRAIRKILPYLQDGMQYYEAKLAAGYDDTTLTKAQNEARTLLDKLEPIQKGELRQPVVEKILNQLVNLVNALMEAHGRFDEIRVELARELKQSQDERKAATDALNKNQRANEEIANRIQTEYHLTPTRTRIQKYKMWEEAEHKCFYCGATVNVSDFLQGSNVEVEHIIPRSVLFDDSFSNKVCSCSACNKEKNNRTAFDFMESRGEAELNAYIERVNANKNISHSKRNKLLMRSADIPSDFIERQLRESQYIAKKAKEMLQSICHNVYATSGSVTDFIRHIWGWDEVLHTINFERYRDAGLTEFVVRDGENTNTERIVDWSKRMDHRHHAVDALTIACTKQAYIQRINNLNTLKDVSFRSFADVCQNADTRQRLTALQKYFLMQPHFSTAQVIDAVMRIAVSFKGGKRAASIGKRYIFKGGKRFCVQKGIIIPRGALSEESVYGRILNSVTGKQEYVIKYSINSITQKDLDSVVDKAIREILRLRLAQFNGNAKNAFATPVLDHQGRPIRSVRCYTGLSAVVPLRYNENGEPISFVKPANNHHLAIYQDEAGKLHEHIVTFWHAVERKKYGIKPIITNPAEAWAKVNDSMPESFISLLPKSDKWKLVFSLQQNEMFILGMDDDEYRRAMDEGDYAALSKHLFRVQKLTKGIYYFRHHLETRVDDESQRAIKMGKLKRLSPKSLFENHPHKVQVSITGVITEL